MRQLQGHFQSTRPRIQSTASGDVPALQHLVRGYRKEPEGYARLVFQGMIDGKAVWTGDEMNAAEGSTETQKRTITVQLTLELEGAKDALDYFEQGVREGSELRLPDEVFLALWEHFHPGFDGDFEDVYATLVAPSVTLDPREGQDNAS